MIPREEVINAYRMLLGREPESELVVNQYAAQLNSVQHARQVFMSSPEFREKVGDILAQRKARVPLTAMPMQVEVSADSQQMTALLQRTTSQWEHLGETEPHWSVLTADAYLQETIDAHRDTFYASGESEMATFEAALARAGLNLDQFSTCLELGCGVGRVTLALSKRFATTGVDVSAAHLDEAARYFEQTGMEGIHLARLESIEGLGRLGAFDVVYSRIVLQHNPPPVMVRLLQGMLAALTPGGVAYFQVPTFKQGYRFAVTDYLQGENGSEMEMHYLPQKVLFNVIAESSCRVLEIREDDSIGMSSTAVSNTLLVRKARF